MKDADYTEADESNDAEPTERVPSDHPDIDHDHPLEEFIVWTDQDPAFLLDVEGVEVHETFSFAEAGCAAVVSTTEEAHDRLHAEGRVNHVEPEFNAHIQILPQEYDMLDDSLATISDTRALHEIPNGATASGVTWVVMDSGIDERHDVFRNTEIEHADATGHGQGDEVGHGTACAGQIAQLAPGVELISLRIFGQAGSTDGRTILRAYEWLHENAERFDGVNMSWGTSSRSPKLDEVHNRLVAEGNVRDVTAAGNTGAEGGSPATASKAFSVGACTATGELASFSSFNPEYDNPDVTAIGKNNKLPQARGTSMGSGLTGPWVRASGTSFAAPIVSAMVAIYLSAGPVDPADVTRLFENAAEDLVGTPREGVGIAKLPEREELPDDPREPQPPDEVDAVVWSPRGSEDWVHLDTDWLDSGGYRARRLEGGETVPETAVTTVAFLPGESPDTE